MIIGVLDSGLGGLTTLAELIKQGVSDYYIYYADNFHSPYGSKKDEQIKEIVCNACRELVKRKADVIVLACNTATSSVIKKLREELTLPIFGLEPAIRVALSKPCEKVLILATEFTLKSDKWHKLYQEFCGVCEVKSLPQLASLVDQYYPHNISCIKSYIDYELKDKYRAECVVLGCTHYILVADLISDALDGAKVFHGNLGLAKLMSSIFQAPQKSTEIEMLFSGEKLYERYSRVLKILVES